MNAAKIHLPPLRERREDIPPLVIHGVQKFAADLLQGDFEPTVSDAAMLRLTAFNWPGNVRQLLNAVQNMVVTGIGSREEGQPVVFGIEHLPSEIRDADSADLTEATGGGSLAGTSLDQLEKRAIRETLRLTAGNREQAAKLLGIGERTLYRKLKEYGLR